MKLVFTGKDFNFPALGANEHVAKICNDKIQPLLEQCEKLRKALEFIQVESGAKSYSYYGPQIDRLYYGVRDFNKYLESITTLEKE